MTEQHLRNIALAGCVILLVLVGLSGCVAPAAKPFESPLPPAMEVPAPPATLIVATVFPTQEPVQLIPVTPAADKSAIVGVVRNSLGELPEGAKVFVANFVWNEEKTVGVFYLDPGNPLMAPIAKSGAFQIADLAPGPYVLVIGVAPEKATPIMGERDQALVIETTAGQVTDLGEQTITLQ